MKKLDLNLSGGGTGHSWLPPPTRPLSFSFFAAISWSVLCGSAFLVGVFSSQVKLCSRCCRFLRPVLALQFGWLLIVAGLGQLGFRVSFQLLTNLLQKYRWKLVSSEVLPGVAFFSGLLLSPLTPFGSGYVFHAPFGLGASSNRNEQSSSLRFIRGGRFPKSLVVGLMRSVRIVWCCFCSQREMALRQMLGWSEGDLMRSDAKPCSRLMKQTAAIFTVGGALGFWVLCRLHYGPRITVPRSLRWAGCGAVSVSTSTATLVRLLSPECEPQNIAAYDHLKVPQSSLP